MTPEGGLNGSGSPISQRHDHPSVSRPEQSAAATRKPPAGLEQARTYLQQLYDARLRDRDYDFKKVFTCRISQSEWSGLCSELDLESPWSERYKGPRFSYNSATSTLKIYAMTSWIHETVVSFFSEHFHVLFARALPKRLRQKIQVFTGLKVDGFHPPFEDSSKVPDLGIFMDNDNTEEIDLKWALEVGFSERYDDLLEDIPMFLIGKATCSMAILVKITESPTYRCPLDFDLDICEGLNIPQDVGQIVRKDFSLEGDYGPVKFKGHQWAGQISAFLEVWTCNPRTGEPRRKRLSRMDIIPAKNSSLQFQLRDFLYMNDDQETSLDWDELRTRLKVCLQSEAVSRCRAWLHESRKRAGLDDTERHF
ncbi:hypothetical protein AYL99_11786 [Fonsecaea erecta]|uniref:Uncharacterized protein n=1 Tax=Fonsecaea erecta TaxID=1367422 RepID=A0A178Z3J5_9EURO|nr:hypothetical protein AYL99_11786 [Fonsecaea erecta]OAP54026.1 hypothetical protein AYL99_11786 [Fonsecaea erecta]